MIETFSAETSASPNEFTPTAITLRAPTGSAAGGSNGVDSVHDERADGLTRVVRHDRRNGRADQDPLVRGANVAGVEVVELNRVNGLRNWKAKPSVPCAAAVKRDRRRVHRVQRPAQPLAGQLEMFAAAFATWKPVLVNVAPFACAAA